MPYRSRFRLAILLVVIFVSLFQAVHAQTNVRVRVMAANTTSGNNQRYEAPGLRIFQGLRPDVVAIQEFNYDGGVLGINTPAAFRKMLDDNFGTNFVYFRESGYNIPNGVISRWPIINSGSWDDTEAPDRGFAWAQIDLPGTNDLYVVSVHFLTSSSSSRATEASNLKALIQSNFPSNAWIIVGGDFNTGSRSETAVNTLKTFLSDSPVPVDQNGNDNTNAGRDDPYDYVLPSWTMTNRLAGVVLPSETFPSGLVFDSRVHTPLSDVTPVLLGDSGAVNMQHMAVIKDFLVPGDGGSPPDTNFPAITMQPQSASVVVGAMAEFKVAATGADPLFYQWRFNTTNIAGANQTNYLISSAQFTNAGQYTVVVTNFAGSITSAIANLTVSEVSTGAVITLAGWDVSALTGFGPSPFPATSNAPGVSVGGLTRGGGVATGGTAAARAWGGNGFDTTGAALAVGEGDFATFTIAPQPGYAVSFNAISRFDYRRSGTGPTNGVVQYQIGNGPFADIAAVSYPVGTSGGAGLSPINLTSIGALQNVIDQTVTFRIVNFNGATGGTWYIFDVDNSTALDFVVQGSIVPIQPPAPPAAPAFVNPAIVSGNFSVSIEGSAGTNYVVQTATNISQPDWISVSTNTAPFIFTDTNHTGAPQRFYRALSR